MTHSSRYPVLLLQLALAAPLGAQTPLERLERVLTQADVNGSVIVTKGGSTVLSAGYGLANRELGVKNTPETKFRIGSITKQFTAMGILILQDRGVLDVHDRLGRHLEAVPRSWRSLTIHQLLTHTSGIMHSWALPGFSETMMVPATLDGTLRRYFDQPLVFEPGEGFRYSGVGYFLLAKIIEVVSGEAYEDFLKSEIFEPLGMGDTGADHPALLLPDRASGYVRGEDGTVENAPVLFMPILTGGGNLFSTVQDLARWDRALAEGALVSEEAYAAMVRPEREGYAYGWRVGSIRGREALAHSGGVPGFNAHIVRIPAEGVCVVVLTNVTPGQAGQVAQALAQTLLDEPGSSRDSFGPSR